jgi:hypothetical protein
MTTTMSDLNPTTATPVQIDTALFPLWERIAREQDHLRCYTHKRVRVGRRTAVEPKTDVELARMAPWDREQMTQVESRLRAAQTAAAPLEEEYQRRGGWPRVWRVTNEDGHVHRHRSCPTCHATTQFELRADLSGLDEDAIIERIGCTACTVCYPTAPTHPAWARTEREAADAKAARQAERQGAAAAKAAKKAANAIAAPDGSRLESWWGDRITTVRQARSELTDEAEERLGGWGNPDKAAAKAAAARRIAEALAAKFGTSVEQELADAEQRARRRR